MRSNLLKTAKNVVRAAGKAAGNAAGKITGSSLRNIRIFKRLFFSFLLLSIVPLAVTGSIAYNRSSSAIESKISTYSCVVMSQLAKNFELEMKKIDNLVTDATLTDSIRDSLSRYRELEGFEKSEAIDNIKRTLTQKFGSVSQVSDATVVTDTGEIISYGSGLFSKEAEMLQGLRQSALARKGTVIWSLVSVGGSCHAVAAKTVDSAVGDVDVGVVVISVKDVYFSNVYQGVDLGTGSEILILDGEGRMVSGSSTLYKVGESLKESPLLPQQNKEQGVEKEALSRSLEVNGEQQMVTAVPIANTRWHVISTVPFGYLNAESRAIGGSILWLCAVCFGLVLVLSLLVSKSISDPLKKLAAFIKQVKEGDLTVRTQDRRRDELSEVVNHFNSMVENFNALLLNVKLTAGEVTDTGSRISLHSAAFEESYRQITMTIDEVANGASSQASDITESVNHMSELSECINQVKYEILAVSEVASTTGKLSEGALGTIEDMKDKAQDSKEAFARIKEEIAALEKGMKEIKTITGVIAKIADQTNLLSLNAAIEAAKVGEAGRGFAVVADEIKKLADQSRNSSVVITEIINKVGKRNQVVVEAANSSSEKISRQLESVMETDKAFKAVYQAMQGVSGQVDGLKAILDKIISAKTNTLDSLENIASVSEEAAATSQEVSSCTQDQLTKTQELSLYAESLTALAEKLNQDISVFHLGE